MRKTTLIRTLICTLCLLPLALQSQQKAGLHFAAGFTVGAATASLNSLTPTQSFVWGTGASFLAGFSKELSDYSKGYAFDKRDLWYSVFGGAASSILVYQIKRHWWPGRNSGRVFFFRKPKKNICR